ncbi:MurR/RpiR family transcriptional regulator [Sporolactobacillus terrae]|uniref:HTH-type transcriptional regulator GlvR n=2 Tax=Sporolactobacillus terrae TaxID=269673 RepID=A0A5K7X4X3_9BACL|nr:MurR/RpiR family transcriptional regulator [Sporolactobacillus terrae]BBN99760.1 HTH-type transcriptional regulator GlvR [Sporolactobacillus terrae]
MKLEMLINKNYDQLNETDLSTLHYIIDHKKECAAQSITELAKSCKISKSSILRTAQKLGFSGFSEFKYSLKNDLEPDMTHAMDYIEQTLTNIDKTMDLFKKTDLVPIYKKIQSAKNIFAYGTGWAQRNAIGELERNFLNSGKMIHNLAAKRELEMIVPYLSEEDLLIIISLSGDISDIIEIVRFLSLKRVPILSITNTRFDRNELANLVPYNLYFLAAEYPIHKTMHVSEDPTSLAALSVLCEAFFFDYVKQISTKDGDMK